MGVKFNRMFYRVFRPRTGSFNPALCELNNVVFFVLSVTIAVQLQNLELMMNVSYV